jgi:hypothetical protein
MENLTKEKRLMVETSLTTKSIRTFLEGRLSIISVASTLIFFMVPPLRVIVVAVVSFVLTRSKFLFPLKAVLAVNRMPALPTLIDVELSGGGPLSSFLHAEKNIIAIMLNAKAFYMLIKF